MSGSRSRAPLVLGGLVVMLAGAYAATLVATEGEPLLVAPLIGAVLGMAVFVRPALGLYMLFAAAILLEQFEITGLDPLTARTHFFQNLSGFSSVPLRLSASDLLAIATLVSWGMRRLVGGNSPVRAGPIGFAVGADFMVFVVGTAIGIARGGGWDAITTLAEARGGVYACLLYFLTANLVRERRQVLVLLWLFVLLVGVKALQGIGNYIEVQTHGPYWIEAVTAHEDVIFFDVAMMLALVMAALRVRGAVVIMIAAVARPRLTAVVVALGTLVLVVYAVTFWNHSGPLAQPIAVFRGVVDPNSISERDQLSNLWREIENDNIAYTVKQVPLTGVGLGQQYLFQKEPPALTNFVYWRYITHNALLWIWLKAGPYGAFAFWFLIARVIMTGLQLYRRLDDPLLRATASFPVLLAVAQVVFSSLDLGLTYNRTMIVFGVALGLMAPLRAWVVSRETPQKATELAGQTVPSPLGGPLFPRRLPHPNM
ncbi:MAG: hypothetical protein E6H91_17380 [Chloroflexi bacterium]|nr:MAG: hypothetical protein E6H91_17380 [Chloroflexota bacterium]